MSIYLIVAAILFCLMLEMLYSGGEVALFASDINKLKNQRASGFESRQPGCRAQRKPEWFISTALVGTNLAIIIASTLITGLMISFFGQARGRTNRFSDYDPDAFSDDYCP